MDISGTEGIGVVGATVGMPGITVGGSVGEIVGVSVGGSEGDTVGEGVASSSVGAGVVGSSVGANVGSAAAGHTRARGRANPVCQGSKQRVVRVRANRDNQAFFTASCNFLYLRKWSNQHCR